MGHSPMSKTYDSLSHFLEETLSLLGTSVLTAPLRINAYNVIVAAPSTDGKQQAVVEMNAIDAKCQDGMTYDMTYCWVCTFVDSSGQGEGKQGIGGRMIGKVRAYIDTDLLTRAIAHNHK